MVRSLADRTFQLRPPLPSLDALPQVRMLIRFAWGSTGISAMDVATQVASMDAELNDDGVGSIVSEPAPSPLQRKESNKVSDGESFSSADSSSPRK